jgi:DNA-directed RNA polymerase II subunit RPB1
MMHKLLRKKKYCDHCNNVQPKFIRVELHLEVEFPDGMEPLLGSGDRRQFLSAQKVVEIFKQMKNEDIESVGLDVTLARPEWLLVSILPVPPIQTRPSVITSEGALVSEDDLTFQIGNIVKSNIVLKASMYVEPDQTVTQFEQSLQYHVASFMNNELQGFPQVTQRSGRPLQTLQQRLQGKHGRIRGNLMGKRVDFSARTVITGDPNLDIDEIGIPKSVAMNLTIPERVTPFNVSQLSQLVSKGAFIHPGAKYIIRNDGTRIDLRYVKNRNDLCLINGWVVERHLRDNDIIVLNRQPSLHKMSIMGHRVNVLDGSTFRLNLSCTSAYNADFDGDEMNLHVPQCLPARAEAEELMMSSKMVVSAQSNQPVMGIVQDALLGAQKITQRDVFIEGDVFFNILMHIKDWDGSIPIPAILKPKQLWTGKQVITMVLPKINFEGFAKNGPAVHLPNSFNNYDNKVTVIDGELVEGIMDKNSIGIGMGGLIHIAWLDVGSKENAKFMNRAQKVIDYWMSQVSFSIGLSDVIATMQDIDVSIDKAKSQVKELAKGLESGETTVELFEHQVNKTLNDARNVMGNTVEQSFTQKNSLKAMLTAGSKGTIINLSQIIACVGQQNIEGRRIPYGFKRRTLPHFCADDCGPESRGFIQNSYVRGLCAQEFFFHAMAGRESLIDTACKTAEAGYIQRRLVKAMESIKTCYDETVRTSEGNVVQFLYGEVSNLEK